MTHLVLFQLKVVMLVAKVCILQTQQVKGIVVLTTIHLIFSFYCKCKEVSYDIKTEHFMKLKFHVLAILASVLLVGCGGKGVKSEFEKCTYPDAFGEKAPGWVCGQPVEAYPMAAVGSANKSAAGFDFMKEQAATVARIALAQQMEVHVTNMVKQYVETTGQGDTETVDQVRTSVSKVLTDQVLVGSKVVNTRTSPNGYLYVLVAIDADSMLLNTQTALKTSMNNDNALWQQFKAENGQDELAMAIANQ